MRYHHGPVGGGEVFDFLQPMEALFFFLPFISTIMLDFSKLIPRKHAIQPCAIV